MDLGKIGVWAWLDHLSANEAAEFAQRAESWGYSALWIPEAVGRDPFALIGYLAARTERLILATGIANIYARDPMATKAIWKTVSELAPDRFILGLGVSHQHLVQKQRGHDYGKPLTTMRNYLEAMDKALYMGRQPEHDAPIVLGALRDKMLQLSATAVQGAHPYLVTPEHTKRARAVIGPDALLCPEQMVLAETDAGSPTTRTTFGNSDLATKISPTKARTGWSMRWSAGGSRRRSPPMSRAISTPARITSAFRPIAQTACLEQTRRYSKPWLGSSTNGCAYDGVRRRFCDT